MVQRNKQEHLSVDIHQWLFLWTLGKFLLNQEFEIYNDKKAQARIPTQDLLAVRRYTTPATYIHVIWIKCYQIKLIIVSMNQLRWIMIICMYTGTYSACIHAYMHKDEQIGIWKMCEPFCELHWKNLKPPTFNWSKFILKKNPSSRKNYV